MTQDELDMLAEGFVVGLKPLFASYKIKIAAIEQRVSALEGTSNDTESANTKHASHLTTTLDKPRVKFRGTWEAGTVYWKGDAVTLHNLLWVCTAPAAEVNVFSVTSWELAARGVLG